MFKGLSIHRAGLAGLALSILSASPAAAVNLFSVAAGRAGRPPGRVAGRAADADPARRAGHELRERDRPRLADQARGPEFPYQVKIVNSKEINAFALPGGYLYVNRGLIMAARSEAELAGVLAHEIAHVAERHGTEQATKAYGAQAGVGLLAQVLGGRDRRLGLPEQIIGSLGVNAAFMKFSRDAEHEADRVGRRDHGPRRLRPDGDGELLRPAPAAEAAATRTRCRSSSAATRSRRTARRASASTRRSWAAATAATWATCARCSPGSANRAAVDHAPHRLREGRCGASFFPLSTGTVPGPPAAAAAPVRRRSSARAKMSSEFRAACWAWTTSMLVVAPRGRRSR